MISDDRLAELIVSMQGNVRIGSVADHVGDALMELRDRRRAALTPPQAGEDAADQASRLMVAAIGESPAPSAPAQEPVAWRRRFRGNDWQYTEREPALLAGWVKEPLYAAPQPAQAEEEQCGSAKSLS